MRYSLSGMGVAGGALTTVHLAAAQSQTPPASPETRQPPGATANPSIPSFSVKAKSGDRTGVGLVFSADRGP